MCLVTWGVMAGPRINNHDAAGIPPFENCYIGAVRYTVFPIHQVQEHQTMIGG
jgi:hypothetical protein